MTPNQQVLSDELIIDLAVKHNLGRKLRPLGPHDTGSVFYTDAGYRTSELFQFADAIESATLAALAQQAQEPVAWAPIPTSAGGRKAVFEFFRSKLKRHDFDRYINEALAADFACVLGGYLAANTTPQPQPAPPVPAPVDERIRLEARRAAELITDTLQPPAPQATKGGEA